MLTTLLLVTAALAPQDGREDLRPLDYLRYRQLTPAAEHVEVASTGRWALLWGADGQLRVLELIPARDLEHAALVDAQCAAFTPDGAALWIGRGEAGLVRLDLTERAVTATVQTSARPVGLTVSAGGLLAWNDARGNGGLLDGEGRARATWSSVSAPGIGLARTPRFAFDRSGRYLAFRTGRGRLAVHDVERGEVVHETSIYLSARGRGFAFAGDLLVFGQRGGSYQVRALHLPSLEERVIEDDCRGVHFLDLFASADGRWVAEWDFEEDGVRVHDLTGELAPRTFGGAGVTFLGFNAANDLWTSAPGGKGLDVWDLERGELVARSPTFEELRLTSATPAFGARVLTTRWKTVEDSIVWTVELHGSVW